MKIAIADDELYVCQQIRECLLQYSTQKNVDMDAPDIYTDCRTLYNTDLSGKRYDVVFMDIDFSGENNIARLFSDSYAVRERCSDGLALGTYLRHILGHQNFDIIYVTSHENYAIHAIPIRPAAFVQKPVTFQKIARALDDSAATMTQSQGVVGTAQYLSPEQARGETVDMRSDLYSAGCVLYEMLTGRPPFTGDSAVAIAYQHVSEVATPPSAVVPGLPKMWDSICAKAMAKDRQNRYATASEFKTDILTYMNGGVPVAAAFNPLTDLSNMKARKEAERDLPTTPVEPHQQPTQAFNPVTGQFEQIPPANGANSAALQSRAQQRAAAAKAKKRKKIIIGSVIAAIVAVLVIVGIVFAMNGSGNKSSEDTVTIPEVCNASTSKDSIELKLKASGLKMTEKQDTDSTEPEGTCTKMSPDAGSKVAKGSAVKVWFSAGPQSTQVPDVKERSQEEARSILESAGFKVNAAVKTEDSADIAKDMVTKTDPAAGQSVPKGTTITIYVSSGMTTVPSNLVGQSKDSVLQQYEGKFSFTVEQESSDTVEAGLITRVSPDSGSSIAQGGFITIWVSTGKEKVAVPNITAGTDYVTAELMLKAVGLKAQANGPTGSTAVVVSINPGAGSQVDAGSTVTITTKAGSTGGGTGTGDGGNGTGNGGGTGE